jgi:hypothetical protein
MVRAGVALLAAAATHLMPPFCFAARAAISTFKFSAANADEGLKSDSRSQPARKMNGRTSRPRHNQGASTYLELRARFWSWTSQRKDDGPRGATSGDVVASSRCRVPLACRGRLHFGSGVEGHKHQPTSRRTTWVPAPFRGSPNDQFDPQADPLSGRARNFAWPIAEVNRYTGSAAIASSNPAGGTSGNIEKSGIAIHGRHAQTHKTGAHAAAPACNSARTGCGGRSE